MGTCLLTLLRIKMLLQTERLTGMMLPAIYYSSFTRSIGTGKNPHPHCSHILYA
jgi:hypothetical protein